MSTPNLHSQKARAARSASAKKLNVLITCEEVKRLPYNSPVRQAHQLDGDRVVVAHYAALDRAAQPQSA